jgi:hypothetical protein
MYLSAKLAIAAIVGAVGVGLPFGLLANRDRPERGAEATVRLAAERPEPAEAPPLPIVFASTPWASEAPAEWPEPAPPRPPEAPPRPPTAPALETFVIEPPVAATPPAAAPLATPAPTLTSAPTPAPPSPTICGATMCSADERCCNASCGICVTAGGTCTNKVCGRPEMPVSVACGLNTCNVGQVCCNASCGICTAPGGSCAPDLCEW